MRLTHVVNVFLCYFFDKSAFQITEEKKMKKNHRSTHREKIFQKSSKHYPSIEKFKFIFYFHFSFFFILFICFLCSNSFLFHVHLNRVFKYTSIKSIEVAQKQTEQEHSLLWCFVCLIYLKRFSINVWGLAGKKISSINLFATKRTGRG